MIAASYGATASRGKRVFVGDIDDPDRDKQPRPTSPLRSTRNAVWSWTG
jgi:hypothetical protein